jgi:hypothetical protein
MDYLFDVKTSSNLFLDEQITGIWWFIGSPDESEYGIVHVEQVANRLRTLGRQIGQRGQAEEQGFGRLGKIGQLE